MSNQYVSVIYKIEDGEVSTEAVFGGDDALDLVNNFINMRIRQAQESKMRYSLKSSSKYPIYQELWIGDDRFLFDISYQIVREEILTIWDDRLNESPWSD